MKKFLFGAAIALLTVASINALLPRAITYVPAVFKKSVVIGKDKLDYPDSCANLQVGDTMSTKGFMLTPTDTGKIPAGVRKMGLLIIRKGDSSLWFYTGKRWRPVNY